MPTITVERILEERDVDAALYLLGRMLGLKDEVVGEQRRDLDAMMRRLKKTRTIDEKDRARVVRAYHEIIG